ncbi:HdeD family acid-resistance protein [Kitasatospora sp. NPDC048365]|uniref:HdeD family acid-resistance protein n=1 Tax=Kitasatospora sp. NPDC048365 TaxID=3364050 RepID=UPI003720114A
MATAPTPTPEYPGLDGPLQRLAKIAWEAVLIGGLISLALGVVVIAWPKETLTVIGVLFGIYLLVIGVVQLVAAFGTHVSTAMRVLAFISGALCVMLGLLCFRSAVRSLVLLGLWIGIGWLFRGITQLAAAASDHAMPQRGWQIFAGVLNVLGGILLMVWPVESITALAVLTGCVLLVLGLVEIVTAFRMRSAAKGLPSGA